MTSNGVTVNGVHPNRIFAPGVYAPTLSFFLDNDDQDIDVPTFTAHVVRLAKLGIAPLIGGSMGEAVHLLHEERVQLIRAARSALDEASLDHIPIIAGTGAASTRETIQFSQEAADAGADYVIIIASGYYAGVLANNHDALKTFWTEAAAKSPLPVIIYNYPAATGGIDLDSDLICELALECPNIVGVKLTCGNVGKLTRIADFVARDPAYIATCCASASSLSTSTTAPRQHPFLVMGGFVDFLTPSIFAQAHGAITGLGNLVPNAVMKLYHLSEAASKDLKFVPEAQKLQGILARADFTIAKAGIAGTKALLQLIHSYGGVTRRPLPPLDSKVVAQLYAHPHVQAVFAVEKSLAAQN
ncbi:aldolase [Fistulina hepatica ATCC 64428]|nr:aldolase [Fistulina hepatica ATCC 64428]